MQRRDMSVYQLEVLKSEARALRSQTLRHMLKSLFSWPGANVTRSVATAQQAHADAVPEPFSPGLANANDRRRGLGA